MVILFSPIDKFLFATVVNTFFIAVILYFNKGRKESNSKGKIILFGIVGLILGLAMNRFFFYFGHYFLEGYYEGHLFVADYTSESPIYLIFLRLGYISNTIGLTLAIFSFEIIYKKSRYVFTILYLIVVILLILLPFEIARALNFSFSFLLTLFLIPFIYYKFALWSKTESKAVAYLFLLSYLLFMHAASLESREIKELNIIPLYITPLFFLLGVFILISPLFFKYKFNSRILKRVFFSCILILIFGWIILLSCFTAGLAGFFLFSNALLNIIIITYIILFLRDINSLQLNKQDLPDLLSIFKKPQRLTEEEVSVSKEKKICLVCKAQVGGILFMCNDCGSFYCYNCYNALIDLENACWACDSALDESKPVKLDKKEEEKGVEVEAESHKGLEKK